jgi:hypothetical protein
MVRVVFTGSAAEIEETRGGGGGRTHGRNLLIGSLTGVWQQGTTRAANQSAAQTEVTVERAVPVVSEKGRLVGW